MLAEKLQAEFKSRRRRMKNSEPIAREEVVMTDVGNFTLAELQQIAKEQGVRYSGLSKAELIEALQK